MTIKEYASKLLTAGFSVIPYSIKRIEGKFNKRPAIKVVADKFHERMKDKEVDIAFDSCNAIAVAGGKVSGNLIILDIENDLASANEILYDFQQQFRTYIDKYKLAIVSTTSGGFHVYVRIENATEEYLKINTLAKYQEEGGTKERVLVEVRGQGSTACTYPSEGYELVQNDLINIIPLPEYVVREFFAFFSKFDYRSVNIFNKRKDLKDSNPKTLYNADPKNKDQALQILLNVGWKIHSKKYRDNQEYYELTRPDKTEGVSATFLYPVAEGVWGLNVFTSNAPNFPKQGFYTLFDVLTNIQYSGNYKESYQKLLRNGYGLGRIEDRLETIVKRFLHDGKEKDVCMKVIAHKHPDLNPESATERINDIYSNYADEFGLKHEPLPEIMRRILSKKYKLWINKYSKDLMMGNEIVDFEGYWSEISEKFNVKCSPSVFKTHLYSGNTVQVRDQIAEYFQNIKPYNPEKERDFIGEFAAKLGLSEHAKEYKEWVSSMLKKHLMRSIRQLFEKKVNRYVFVLAGGENMFKTSWIRYMSYFLPQPFFHEKHEAGVSKDDRVMSCQTFMTNMDDIENISGERRFKAIISEESVNLRGAFEHKSKSNQRITNYWGTTNQMLFLEGNSENTRILSIPVDYIDGSYCIKYQPGNRNNINFGDLWRQAHYLYLQGKQDKEDVRDSYCELTAEEIVIQKHINGMHTDDGITRYMISKLFKQPRERGYAENVKIGVTDLRNAILQSSKISNALKTMGNVSLKAIGSAMERMDFVMHERIRYKNYLSGEIQRGKCFEVELVDNGRYGNE